MSELEKVKSFVLGSDEKSPPPQSQKISESDNSLSTPLKPMNPLPPACQDLEKFVEDLIKLAKQEDALKSQDFTRTRISLNKAISPRFEIVFAGAYSAGKSMLINALFEEELLYSSSGHATGTECQIQSPGADGKEKVILTFLSQGEINQQIAELLGKLKSKNSIPEIHPTSDLKVVQRVCDEIINAAGGKDKTPEAEWANALNLLIQGLTDNQKHILDSSENELPMESLGFQALSDAVSYVRQGANSAVLRRVEYYYRNKLLEGGNVIVDTPGIDAPVARDADLTYQKLENPDTSAVVCVFKSAISGNGELSTSERKLLARIRSNPSIGDRVFNIFNYIDNTWYDPKTEQLVDALIKEQFRHSRVYKTSALLGFCGSLIKKTDEASRFGLSTIFADEANNGNGKERTPKFVSEFNRFCGISGKLVGSPFRVSVHGFDEPNDTYVRIIKESGFGLVDYLISQSGIEGFREAITDYLTREKSPQLYGELARNLLTLCSYLRNEYQRQFQALMKSRPGQSFGKKDQIVVEINEKLQQIGESFYQAIRHEIDCVTATQLEENKIIANDTKQAVESSANDLNGQCQVLREQYLLLKQSIQTKIDEIDSLSLKQIYDQAVAKQESNSTAPINVLLSEPFDKVSGGLESVFRQSAEQVIETFFDYLIGRITNIESSHMRDLLELAETDAGIEQKLRACEAQVKIAIDNHAIVECDRYRREDKTYYGLNRTASYSDKLKQALSGIKIDEKTLLTDNLKMQIVGVVLETLRLAISGGTSSAASLLSQIIEKTDGFGVAVMSPEQEDTIKKFLKENFSNRVYVTVDVYFPQIIRQTLKTYLNRVAQEQRTYITQLASSSELQSKLDLLADKEERLFAKNMAALLERVRQYNAATAAINQCLSTWKLEISLPISNIEDRVSGSEGDLSSAPLNQEEST